MTAGLNLRIDIYKPEQITDDASGGSVKVFTKVYSTVQARIVESPVGLQQLAQGAETNRIGNCWVSPARLTIKEGYELVVLTPNLGELSGARYTVLSLSNTGMTDGRGFKQFRISRILESRTKP